MARKWSAIRRYADDTVDDVAISADLFRLEVADDNAIWAAAYRGEDRAMFWIKWDKKRKRLIVHCSEDALGCVDDSSAVSG